MNEEDIVTNLVLSAPPSWRVRFEGVNFYLERDRLLEKLFEIDYETEFSNFRCYLFYKRREHVLLERYGINYRQCTFMSCKVERSKENCCVNVAVEYSVIPICDLTVHFIKVYDKNQAVIDDKDMAGEKLNYDDFVTFKIEHKITLQNSGTFMKDLRL